MLSNNWLYKNITILTNVHNFFWQFPITLNFFTFGSPKYLYEAISNFLPEPFSTIKSVSDKEKEYVIVKSVHSLLCCFPCIVSKIKLIKYVFI